MLTTDTPEGAQGSMANLGTTDSTNYHQVVPEPTAVPTTYNLTIGLDAPRKKRVRKPKAPRKPRDPRQPHKLVVGSAVDDPPRFLASITQPETPLTEVADLVAWAQKNLEPGEYDVIRILPGKLTVAKQETFKAGFVEAK